MDLSSEGSFGLAKLSYLMPVKHTASALAFISRTTGVGSIRAAVFATVKQFLQVVKMLAIAG